MDTFEITNDRKLADEDVLVIRVVHMPGHTKFGTNGLAALFGVAPAVITNVVTRKTYKHLPIRQVPEGAVVRTKFAYAEAGKRARAGLEAHLAARNKRLRNLRGVETRRANTWARLSDEAAAEYRKAIGLFEASKGKRPKEIKTLLARLDVRAANGAAIFRAIKAGEAAQWAAQREQLERERAQRSVFELAEHGPTRETFTAYLNTAEGMKRQVALYWERRAAAIAAEEA
ncbi:hypothetical protein [Paraburkholderia kirstenboschensis]|uniref:Uncharacterized protein n=1 Tax=Paraburkholderia kirstenboschensis TaxID=1245436 RepID=A0ABZ0EFF4_9BURK|nr:hypothetical protein [Paraburkholderia kirstenboschensis]WOD15955.1 hypothetical protein RW095_22260 [Paraburkholderia kirstenboschensis]